ncbi:MAG: PilN domain-containing protein [Pseudoalteromonas sp.]|uniref:PilN domain-containing protein n=1 Tax=unclassified Pseudoalteromonas TaxID=194690 RepID=UPI000C07F956|nr:MULTISPECIES: PilN domain-containing protein [unclassified Pseudoalteromonas]MDP2634478.1 PilN domain-containing protein [Pseudoalteromonas sp. 1_MG-2023]PHN90258.1 pilus assembly protein PilN [Pseudoalteromonas sp. 3D05]TGE83106.1 pilus assembly protein PilN [Pseudoalteromonas sp. KS88]
MPHINLLPWREQQRKQSQNKFATILFLVVLVSFLSMYMLSAYYGGLRDGQNIKNNFLNAEIAQLDMKIREIRELDRKKESLQQRMRLIEDLQSSRNLGTQIMDEVAKIVPGGVYLTKLERRGSVIQVIGRSESNNRLSSMLRQVQNSYLLEKPSMQGIVAGESSSRLLSDFNMEFYVKPFDKIGENK